MIVESYDKKIVDLQKQLDAARQNHDIVLKQLRELEPLRGLKNALDKIWIQPEIKFAGEKHEAIPVDLPKMVEEIVKKEVSKIPGIPSEGLCDYRAACVIREA